MGLSIITPHYNDFEGLKRVYGCLLEQSNGNWEWIIVDDVSNEITIDGVENKFKNLDDHRVKLICNSNKTNASVCRNLGADKAQHEHLVFLDADDYITNDFVANRQVNFIDFAVFGNYNILNEQGHITVKSVSDANYLNSFLSTNFLWQTSCVLWNKSFFNAIGQFHSELARLQDVELSIRALQKSTKYTVINNPVDFHYRVKPIRQRQHFVKPVCDSVYLFISELLDTSSLSTHQVSLITSYYYLCTKYLERSESFDDITLVKRNLNLFYKKRYIHFRVYISGLIILKLYHWRLVSSSLFLRINRYLFKSK